MSQVSEVTILGWTVPRPTGRWHQSIIVTDRDVLITPELPFGENEQLLAAAEKGMVELYAFIKGAGWIELPQRSPLADVDALKWNAPTGMMQIRSTDGSVMSAMIPNRGVGEDLVPQLQLALKDHAANS
jgi:hypothetical protein